MIKKVNIKTSIKDYKSKKENSGKVALYDTINECVFLEGDDLDWEELQEKMEEMNKTEDIYYLIIVPHS
ncbi:MAG: hypothetical protein IJV04_08430, partial [Lachnospiraceae bacterium]|nr:hypothetical protein [Lachnospiraceae bacterium]